jgi:hypothetical protein
MKTKKRIFLPKWQRWFMVPLFVSMWLFITYMEFFNPDNSENLGIVGYVFMSLLFLGVGVMMYLMTSGKLPAYIIEETKEKEK